MTIEAKPRLEPQTVARTEPDGFDFRFAQQFLCEFHNFIGGHRNLVAVLAGVARTADVTRDARDIHVARGHKIHLRHRGRKACQHFNGLGSLQRDQRTVFDTVELNACRQVRLNMRKILMLAGGIDDNEQRAFARGTRHHEVVADAALVVEQQGVADGSGHEACDVARHEGFERSRHRRVVRSHKKRLAHVRHIEQARRGTRVQMLGEHAVLILDRHVIAGKRHHLCTKRDVERVQGG